MEAEKKKSFIFTEFGHATIEWLAVFMLALKLTVCCRQQGGRFHVCSSTLSNWLQSPAFTNIMIQLMCRIKSGQLNKN